MSGRGPGSTRQASRNRLPRGTREAAGSNRGMAARRSTCGPHRRAAVALGTWKVSVSTRRCQRRGCHGVDINREDSQDNFTRRVREACCDKSRLRLAKRTAKGEHC